MLWSTYSPEDNKLRLYSSKRLDEEVYKRVKEQGFRWAPKQELFVAPMWTPSREDLLIELCGEIGDEDTSLVERQEQRAERFEEYRDSRAEDARRAHENAHAIGARFEGGQPILVGHHSEKRARKDKERMDGAMRAAVKMWDTSQYWQDRAKGAIRHAKYKERPDVRARRIKTLEAEQRKCQRSKDQAEKGLKVWTLLHDDTLSGIKKKDGSPTTFAERAVFVAGHSNTASMGTYSDLTANPPRITPEVAQAQAIAMNERAKAHSERWIAHYTNRIAYERAMLDEAGGTLSEQKGCETGGAVRCWASPRGGWSYIQKVNKVTVTVLDNWGNGGTNFTRTIEFDKLAGIMTAAEVQAKRDAGLLYETDDKTGFILMDSKPAPKPQAAEPVPAPEIKEGIDAMRDALRNGGVSVVVAPQLFPTPAHLAARMVELAELGPDGRLLEPSAGTGAILDAARGTGAEIMAFEINPKLCEALRAKGYHAVQADFLERRPEEFGLFDVILMNPPFKNGEDIKHIRHAMTFVKPGGRLVALCANGPRQNDQLKPLAASWEVLPEGTFAEAGTNVNTALLTWCAPADQTADSDHENEPETAPEAPELGEDHNPQPDTQEAQDGAPEREESPVLTLSNPEPVVERTDAGLQYRLFL